MLLAVDGRLVTVVFKDGSEVSVTASEVERVPLKKNDKIKVVRGDSAGSVGTLMNIDQADGFVKVLITCVFDTCLMYCIATQSRWATNSSSGLSREIC